LSNRQGLQEAVVATMFASTVASIFGMGNMLASIIVLL
jgi:hypothetical protein